MAYAKINSVTNANMAKVNNAAKAALGKIGSIDAPSASFENTKSVILDGSDEYLNVSNEIEWNGTGSFSWWMKESSNSNAGIFSVPGFSFYVQIYLDTRFIIENDYLSGIAFNTYTPTSPQPLGDGNWHHWAITMEGSPTDSTQKLYLDGANLNTLSRTDGDGDKLADTTFAIGTFAGAPGYEFNGNLDEIGYWNAHILTGGEITTLYNSGTPIDLEVDTGYYASSGDLTAYWRMGDGDTYPTIQDNVGSSDATMTNMASGDIVEDVPSA
jgi:hypothetical protein